MKISLLFFISFVGLLSACSLFEEDSSDVFEPISEERMSSFFFQDTTYTFEFIIDERSEENDDEEDVVFHDTLVFRSQLDSLFSNTYQTTEAQEAEFSNNSNLVLSQQQFRIHYSIELIDFLSDTTYVFIEENDDEEYDTTYYHLNQAFIDSVYEEEKLTFSESSSLILNTFDLNNDLQATSYNRFNDAVTASELIWLPDNTFAPSTNLFWTFSNAIVFGAHSYNHDTKTTQIMEALISKSIESSLN